MKYSHRNQCLVRAGICIKTAERLFLFIVLICTTTTAYCESNAKNIIDEGQNTSNVKPHPSQESDENQWWKKRQKRPDIYYPHNIHKEVMTNNGDSCMLCHAFSKNVILDEALLKQLAIINNEPLESICHDCHVDERSAPTECAVCHPDPATVWPQDHNFDYKNNHGLDASHSIEECESCHIESNFCSDCHFNRGTSKRDVHPLGYQYSHGLDAQIRAPECGSCHGVKYCVDCHEKR